MRGGWQRKSRRNKVNFVQGRADKEVEAYWYLMRVKDGRPVSLVRVRKWNGLIRWRLSVILYSICVECPPNWRGQKSADEVECGSTV